VKDLELAKVKEKAEVLSIFGALGLAPLSLKREGLRY
jgi:hypothetical protein